MNMLRSAAIALTLALSTGAGAFAQAPGGLPPDALSDPSMKAPEVLAFMGVKPGDQVADVVAGRFLRAISQAVGPKGKVYAVEPDELTKLHPEIMKAITLNSASPEGKNIEVIGGPINAAVLPKGLSAVFIRQNYHDLYDKFMGPADVAAFNKKVFAALKPGGVYVILDHSAAKGSGLTATEGLHRIDEDAVVKDVTAAGFKLDARSDIFANAADPRDKMVFHPSIRGKTDQFLLRFRKPK